MLSVRSVRLLLGLALVHVGTERMDFGASFGLEMVLKCADSS